MPPPAYAQFAQRETRRPAPPPEQAALVGADRAVDPAAAVFEGAKPVAIVGNEVILASEVYGDIDEIMAANADKVPPGQFETIRQHLIQQRLQQRLPPAIEAKLLIVDARRKVPEANMPKILEHLGEEFDTKFMSQLMKRAGVETRADVDAKLREQGSTLERFKRNWIEQQLAVGWLNQQTKTDAKPVTHDEMLKYYYDHLDEFDFPAKARWEQLMVRLDNQRSRQESESKLAQMGNDVMRGVELADVARAHSEGPTANDGGHFDWTSRGSLASSVLDEAIFALPVGRLSKILEDDHGLYIVRVIERTDAGRKTFSDMQGEIKKAIEKRREDSKDNERTEYLARLKREIPVWTVFDDAEQGATGRDRADQRTAEQAAYQGPADPPNQRPAARGPSDRQEPPDRYGQRSPAMPPPR